MRVGPRSVEYWPPRLTPPESVRDRSGRCCTAVGRRARGRVPRSYITDTRTEAGIVIARPVKLTGCTRALPAFWEIFGSNHCACGFLTLTHTTPTGIIYARQSYLDATFPKNRGAGMLDCNHFVIFNLCLYGNSLNQTPISPRLETITSLASALPGRPTAKTSITTQNSDAVRSTTEVLRTAFCLRSALYGCLLYTATCLPRRATPPVVSTQSSRRLDGSHVS